MNQLNRRQFLKVSAVPGMALALGATKTTPGIQQFEKKTAMLNRPNVLWICTDQQRYDTIRVLGNPYIRTPNIDKLVATGAAFTHAHCQSPICTPSRSSFLTGMYPSTIHACINGSARWGEAAPLITKILADTGRGDLNAFKDALVKQYETDFMVSGKKTLSIRVDRRADQ